MLVRESSRHPGLSLFACLVVGLCAGCLSLDGFVHNARHCSAVEPETCEEEEPFNRFCTPCEEPYDWSVQYPWPQGFLPEGRTVRAPQQVEPMTLETEDGKGTLDMVWIPAHGEDVERARVTLVYQHGNYGSMEHYVPRARILHELGYNVLYWDYRGYGKSTPDVPGETDEFLADARQVLAFAATKAPDTQKIVVYGMSLGAVPSVEMALHDRPCALILEVPFTSIREISDSNAGVGLPGGFLTRGYFENAERIKDYEGPLMVLHGTQDDAFPLESVERLYENAPGPKVMHVVEGALHGVGRGVPETAGLERYGAFIEDFLREQAAGCP
jgi:uncharacterized protein